MLKLTQQQIDAYRQAGFVIVTEVLTDSDLQPVIDEMSEHIHRRTLELKAQGKITDLCEDQPFEKRYAGIYAQCKEIVGGIDIMQLRGRLMFEFLHNENLLNVVEDMLGSGEILCNPIQHIRAKVPASLAGTGPDYYHNVPWHQDAGVTWEEADASDIVTFWIPLVDATKENGCMEVMPDVWRLGHLQHQKEGGTTIVPDLLPKVSPVTAACPKRGIVMMNKCTPHRSTPNHSDGIRWSLDLRYQRVGEPTGRPFHPAFVARSRKNPSCVYNDHEGWCRQWIEALEKSKGIQAHRVK